MQVLLFTTINLKSNSLLFLKTQIHFLNGKCILNFSNKYMDSILQKHNIKIYNNIKNWFNDILIIILDDYSKVLNLFSIIKEYNLNLHLISYYLNESYININNNNITDIILSLQNNILHNNLIIKNMIINNINNFKVIYKYYLYLAYMININKFILYNNINYNKCLKIH
jgi:hypothetical protein